jgi:hypothetical protein
MPEAFVQFGRERNESVASLAAACDVSVEAMSVRLGVLGLLPELNRSRPHVVDSCSLDIANKREAPRLTSPNRGKSGSPPNFAEQDPIDVSQPVLPRRCDVRRG